MKSDPFSKALAATEKKTSLLATDPWRYVLSSVLAGAYLTLVGFVFWAIKQNYGVDPSGKLLSSLFFGVGLSVIIITSIELFTSNNMYMAMGMTLRKTSIPQGLYLWVVCWLGNFLGAAIMAALLYAAHALEAMPVDHAILAGARHKIEMGATEIFFKGIFANGIVCLAVWLNLQLRNESAKLFETILVIFIFLYLGFEHSIANMGTFSIALMADPSLSLAGIGHNLLWSTLGNIVGGAMIGIAAIGAKLPKS